MKNELFILNALLYLVVFLFVAVIVVFIMSIMPIKVAKFNTPYIVLTPIVKQGDDLIYKRDVEKLMDAKGEISCRFVDAIVYEVPSKINAIETGKNNDTVAITVPANLPPALYHFECTIDYIVFGFRHVNYEFYTDTFEVVKK